MLVFPPTLFRSLMTVTPNPCRAVTHFRNWRIQSANKAAAEIVSIFNMQLHQSSERKIGDKTEGYMLPKLYGKERFVAVSSCRTVTFCRAAIQNCITENDGRRKLE